MTMTLSAIQGWGAEVQSAMTSAATGLESAALTGSFARVLAQVANVLAEGPGATTSSTGADGDGTATALGETLGGPVSGGDVVAEAQKFLGTPYVWGGESPTGFDCSGLVQYVYGQLGISVPRTSEEQALAGTPVASLADATPGDLVFFAGSDGTATSPGHVGIYIGGGMMIDAPHTGTEVQVQPVSDAGTVVAIRQIVPTAASSGLMGAGLSSFGLSSLRSSSLGLSSSGLSALGLTDGDLDTLSGAASAVTSTTAVPPDLASLFVQAAGKYGVPVSVLTAVARRESNFDTAAVSTAGAEGLMQLMPETAAGLGVTPFTARQAIDGAAQLLSGYLDRFGSVPLALAAYNAGSGAVEEFGGVPPYAQTQGYVADIMATLEANQ